MEAPAENIRKPEKIDQKSPGVGVLIITEIVKNSKLPDASK
jgi:hypothetical protein